MKGGILLSDKHGVNPSLLQCFICGEDAGVALVGRLPGDVEAPRRMCDPRYWCKRCEDVAKVGVFFIEVRDDSRANENPFRTGRLAALTEEAVRRNVGEPMLSNILKSRIAYVTVSDAKKSGLDAAFPARKEDEVG